jgi:hypothetical protein
MNRVQAVLHARYDRRKAIRFLLEASNLKSAAKQLLCRDAEPERDNLETPNGRF